MMMPCPALQQPAEQAVLVEVKASTQFGGVLFFDIERHVGATSCQVVPINLTDGTGAND